MRRPQHRRPSLSRCLHPQFHPQRVARHVIDVAGVVVAGPPPKRRMQRLWMGMRVRNLICLYLNSYPLTPFSCTRTYIAGVAVPGPSNRRSGGGRSRASGSRRNQNTGDQAPRRANGAVTSASAPPASFTRTYSSTQQPQQPLLTSWGLPDYLAHLEPTLPTKTPQPLQLRGSCEERGVRVRWPGKRMSVGDMNKRVRALVEWVGREQASASERYRRRESLQAALGDPTSFGVMSVGDSSEMIVEGAPPPQPPPPPPPVEEKIVDAGSANGDKSTMKMMEELMEELIVFQERYGPGAKSKDRRTAVLS